MLKIIKTLLNNVRIFSEEYFFVPLIIAIAIYTIIKVISCKSKRNKNAGILKNITFFISLLYFCELFYTTLLYRINYKTDSLSNVWGEWSIFDGETSMYINPKPILNVILFIPLCFSIVHFVKYLFNKEFKEKQLLIKISVLSFFLSLFIETTQLIFCLGTFQISDLFYNTLGGFLGALIYILVVKFIKNKRTITM